ncbi:transglutaminase family protein [Bradyrhizobium sp. th.b2]|uniref:transglutaminase family protein n=1 Tax=Bradyrhizobium sp. th-b2 TaxID=172088 RepID=UPI0004227188|nr:transglutaminase family protein [Bradyrhizobium sp. th.b2]
MAHISIVHTTEYIYRNPVGLLRHKLMVRPDESHDLRLHGATLKVDPEPTSVYWKHDVFNNSICYLEWSETLRTKQLSIVSTLDVTHHPDGQPLPVYSLDEAAELFPFSYDAQEIPDLARLAERQMPDPDRKVDAWALRVVSEANSKQTLKVLEAMTHAIKREFRYNARYEEGTHTAAQTLALGSGTCRDFAVLMMEALRSFGFATRFVTGYLYDDSSGTTPRRRQHARLVQRLSARRGLGRIRSDQRPDRRRESGPRRGDPGGRPGHADIGRVHRQCERSNRAARGRIGPHPAENLSAHGVADETASRRRAALRSIHVS